ncbi:Exopolysacchride production negative regulator ExoR [hydrothermal vent metagenome]|uniref:Exopolysacchride production negative regulator ExoR n=1 Tax=hydrothermal vent metagenome TaxID=652676 RepID=A0A3B0TDJ7_9ZZZZ
MRTFSASGARTGSNRQFFISALFAMLALSAAMPARAQTDPEAAAPSAAPAPQSAADVASQFSNLLGGAEGGVSSADMIAILEDAAKNGQPLALWRLGEMYEKGLGVKQDQARAFSYYSRIANDNANTPPRSIEADIVARSFVKIGDYYRVGLPSAGISANQKQFRALLLHAASYFGNADAQYRVGLLYLDSKELGVNPLQSARWFSLAAHKGQASAQAVLGDMLFNGSGIAAKPVEGLMWLTLAQRATIGSKDEVWVNELATRAMSVATPDQRKAAIDAADMVRQQIPAK